MLEENGPDDGDCGQTGDVKAGQAGNVAHLHKRCAQHGAKPCAQEGERKAAHNLIGAQCNCDNGVQQCHKATNEQGRQ